PMSPFEFLKKDHRKVEALFEKIGKVKESDFGRKLDLLEKLRQEIRVHSTLEEEIFYPALRDAGAREMVQHALSDHQEADALLEEAANADASNPRFDTLIRDLKGTVEQHVVEEEAYLFPEGARLLSGEQLEILQRRLRLRKQDL